MPARGARRGAALRARGRAARVRGKGRARGSSTPSTRCRPRWSRSECLGVVSGCVLAARLRPSAPGCCSTRGSMTCPSDATSTKWHRYPLPYLVPITLCPSPPAPLPQAPVQRAPEPGPLQLPERRSTAIHHLHPPPSPRPGCCSTRGCRACPPYASSTKQEHHYLVPCTHRLVPRPRPRPRDPPGCCSTLGSRTWPARCRTAGAAWRCCRWTAARGRSCRTAATG